MRATIADIAKHTGLTQGTVSRALSPAGKYPVSAKTRQKVSEAASQLGYRPNILGKALAAGSSGLVCLLAPLPFSAYYTSIARQLARRSARQGYCLVTDCAYDSQFDEGGESVTEIPRQEWLYGVDGIIACDPAPWHREYLEEAGRLRIPTVGMGSRFEQGMDSVKIDLHRPSRQLIRHLLEQGYRSIAMMVPNPAARDGPRTSAYCMEMAQAGMPLRFLEVPDYARRSGRETVLAHVAEHGPFDALFCANDELAIGACRAISDLGWRMPQDVGIAGCDGIEDGLYQTVPITTLVQPYEEVCELAWQMLKRRIDGDDGPVEQVELAARLEIRRSTLRGGLGRHV